jgi:hypothetical protein
MNNCHQGNSGINVASIGPRSDSCAELHLALRRHENRLRRGVRIRSLQEDVRRGVMVTLVSDVVTGRRPVATALQRRPVELFRSLRG